MKKKTNINRQTRLFSLSPYNFLSILLHLFATLLLSVSLLLSLFILLNLLMFFGSHFRITFFFFFKENVFFVFFFSSFSGYNFIIKIPLLRLLSEKKRSHIVAVIRLNINVKDFSVLKIASLFSRLLFHTFVFF